MYTPPSQYRSGFYSNNKYYLVSTGTPYKGPYYKMKDGRYYTGDDPNTSFDPQPLYLPDAAFENPDNIQGHIDTVAFIDNKLVNHAYKQPNGDVMMKDYPKSYSPTNKFISLVKGKTFRRFFAKRNDQQKYIEINQKDYNALRIKSPKITCDLYSI